MKHVDRDIERYFDGGIRTPEAHEALFGHLDRCPTCRTYFDELAVGHRLLAGPEHRAVMPATELALMLPIVVERSALRPASRAPSWVWSVFGPALAATFALLFFRPSGELVSKGAPHPLTAPVVEVLCFDQKFEVTAHLERDGDCPAPGFIKVVYASPWPVERLTVAAISADQIRFVARLSNLGPRSVVPNHARLEHGETLKIVVSTDPLDDRDLTSHPAAITVSGVDP